MKKTLLFTMLFSIAAFMSCKKDDDSIPREKKNMRFNLSVPALQQTKNANITRYIAAIYKTSDPATVVHRIEQASGTIVISLEDNTNYTCLFWADDVALNDNTTGTYNALDLKNVTLNTGKQMSEAFFARLDITDATTTFAVAMKRSTARVNIIETDVVVALAPLAISYMRFESFNTFTSDAIGTTFARNEAFSSAATSGTLGTFLTFASVTGILADITATYNNSTINTLPGVALKANYITNIRGKYAQGDQTFTFIITVDENIQSVIDGVDINVGTAEAPNWIKVADRNAEKGSVHGATADKTATDYGYYYQWSNASNDAANADKAYRACFDFAEGNGLWRLPTMVEWVFMSGNSGQNHTINANRKLQWDAGTSTWRLYDERIPGQTTNFVSLPMGGYKDTSGTDATANEGSSGDYWTSTDNGGTNAWRGIVNSSEESFILGDVAYTTGFPVRCVRTLAQ